MSKFKKALMVTALATTLTGMSVAVMANTGMEPQLLAQHTAQRATETGTPGPHMHGARHAGMGERMAKHREARLAKLKETLKIATRAGSGLERLRGPHHARREAGLPRGHPRQAR